MVQCDTERQQLEQWDVTDNTRGRTEDEDVLDGQVDITICNVSIIIIPKKSY